MAKTTNLLIAGMLLGAAALTIARDPKPVLDVCSTIFRNIIVKGALSGLAAGLTVSTIWAVIESRKPHQGGGMPGAVARGIIISYLPPIIGTVAGALIGGIISLSRHVTIQIK